jgi:hypothetical protein
VSDPDSELNPKVLERVGTGCATGTNIYDPQHNPGRVSSDRVGAVTVTFYNKSIPQ